MPTSPACQARSSACSDRAFSYGSSVNVAAYNGENADHGQLQENA